MPPSLAHDLPLPHLSVCFLKQDRVAMWIWQLPGPSADGGGSEALSFNTKQKLDTGFHFGLAEDTV